MRDVHPRHLLDLLQDVEAATAAIALHRIGRIGDELQLLEHELRDHERSVHETGFTDVRDAAVDDDARVEDLVSLARPGRPEQVHEVLRLEPLALTRTDHDSKVRQRQQDDAVKEDDASVTQVGPVERGADGLGREQTDGSAQQGADHMRDGDVLEAQLEGDDQQPQYDAENGVENGIAE